MTPWVTATGQRWKLVCFAGLALTAFASAALLVLAVNGVRVHDAIDQIEAAGMLIATGFSAFAWLCFSMRCEKCRCSPAWHLMRTAPVNQWFTILMTAVDCPVCGHKPEEVHQRGARSA